MQSHNIISFIGDDRPGLVGVVAAAISSHGGNWMESRLSQLGGKFAGLVLLRLPQANAATLKQEIKKLSSASLSIRLTGAGDIPEAPIQSRANITLTLLGPDRPGIVRELSSALSERGVNVLEMETRVLSAPMTGEALFEASVSAYMADEDMIEELLQCLDEIANEMTLDIDYERR